MQAAFPELKAVISEPEIDMFPYCFCTSYQSSFSLDMPMAGDPLPPVASNVMSLIFISPQYITFPSPTILNPTAAPSLAVIFSLVLPVPFPLIVMFPRRLALFVPIILIPAPVVEVNSLSVPSMFSVTFTPLLMVITSPVVSSFTFRISNRGITIYYDGSSTVVVFDGYITSVNGELSVFSGL